MQIAASSLWGGGLLYINNLAEDFAMKYMRLFTVFFFFCVSCASCINTDDTVTPTITSTPSNVNPTITSTLSTTPHSDFISFNAIKESGTYIAFLPTDCLRNYQNCSLSAIYSPDIYQKEMASPLVWEPSGQKFVILTNLRENQDLTIGTFTDGTLERFTIETSDREDCPIWSPNGKIILFTKEVYTNGEYQSELWTINGDGTNPRFLTKGNCGSWSPDGQQIIYSIYSSDQSISQKIYVINFSDTTLGEPSYIKTGLDYIGKIFYSPDGKNIAFEGVKEEKWSIYLINTDGSGFLELTPMFPDAISPVWSPNGQKIAFTAHSSQLEPSEIYTIDTNGTNLINISNSPVWDDSYPSWAPDNSMIVFMSQRETDFSNIYVVNSDGTGLKKLTEDDNKIECMYPNWQP